MSKQQREQQTVAACEKVLADLEAKRQQHRERAVELEAERKRTSYDAFVQHEPSARKELSDVIDETVRHESEGRALADAVIEAQHRLEAARAQQAKAADREAAAQLRATFAEFVAFSESLDAFLAKAVKASIAASAAINRIHSLGHAAPTGQQWLTYGAMALHSQLMQTPWAREFRHLAPRERRVFADLAHDWQAAAERAIAQRLGEKEKADAAA